VTKNIFQNFKNLINTNKVLNFFKNQTMSGCANGLAIELMRIAQRVIKTGLATRGVWKNKLFRRRKLVNGLLVPAKWLE
jgi:hypothetical protein